MPCLQEGFRYNALHMCASKNKPKSCKLILELIEDPCLMQLLYPDDTPETRETRIGFCLDLYLNTPDKNVGICLMCIITLFLFNLVCIGWFCSFYKPLHCLLYAFYDILSLFARKHSGESWIYSMGQKNGLHMVGYTSAESEPIWMSSGIV